MINVLVVMVWLASLVAFGLGLTVMIRPQPRLRLNHRWHGAALMGGAFLAFFAAGLVLGATYKPEEPSAVVAAAPAGPPMVAKAAPEIRSVTEDTFHDGPRLVVDMKADAWSEADYLFNAGNVVKAIGGALQAGAPDGGTAPTVALVVSTTGVDRLGAESDMVLMTLYFSRADLLAARFDNLSVGRTLNLATDIDFASQGAKAIVAYCLTNRGQTQSQPFCALAERNA